MAIFNFIFFNCYNLIIKKGKPDILSPLFGASLLLGIMTTLTFSIIELPIILRLPKTNVLSQYLGDFEGLHGGIFMAIFYYAYKHNEYHKKIYLRYKDTIYSQVKYNYFVVYGSYLLSILIMIGTFIIFDK